MYKSIANILMQPSMLTLNPPSSLYHDSPLSPLFWIKIHHMTKNVMPRFTRAFYRTEKIND